jgi:CRP/FNR family transcriptional regulator
VFNLISTRLIQITAKVEGIVLESFETRLRNWLIDRNTENIYTTHEEIANQLGSAREVVSRQLKKWEMTNKVKLYRGKIRIIDL